MLQQIGFNIVSLTRVAGYSAIHITKLGPQQNIKKITKQRQNLSFVDPKTLKVFCYLTNCQKYKSPNTYTLTLSIWHSIKMLCSPYMVLMLVIASSNSIRWMNKKKKPFARQHMFALYHKWNQHWNVAKKN